MALPLRGVLLCRGAVPRSIIDVALARASLVVSPLLRAAVSAFRPLGRAFAAAFSRLIRFAEAGLGLPSAFAAVDILPHLVLDAADAGFRAVVPAARIQSFAFCLLSLAARVPAAFRTPPRPRESAPLERAVDVSGANPNPPAPVVFRLPPAAGRRGGDVAVRGDDASLLLYVFSFCERTAGRFAIAISP